MFLLLSVVLTGISLGLCLWTALKPAAVRVPTVRDQSRPWFVRLLWPWVIAFKPLCEPLVPWRTRAHLMRLIRLAAIDKTWKPVDLFALQVVLFVACAAPVALAGHVLLEMLWGQNLFCAILSGALAGWLPRRTVADLGRQRQRRMLRELPFLLDMTTLCVEAGLNLQGALQRAAQYGPEGPMRQELHHTLAEIRAGTPRFDALDHLAERTGLCEIASLVNALKQADQTGSSLGPLLRAQSDQQRSEQFLRAEEQALKAPVKMLFPMVVFIFPCTFLMIGFPVMMKVFRGIG